MPLQEKPLSQAIKERRATPAFDGSPIPDADLKQIMQEGLEAPSAYNSQPWRFVVVRDPQQRAALQTAAFNQSKVGNASAIVVACGNPDWKEDVERLVEDGRRAGTIHDKNEDVVRKAYTSFRSTPAGDVAALAPDWTVWLNRHVMIAFTTIMWAAETHGYDTAPMEGFVESAVKKTLGIPDHIRVVALLSIGKRQGEDKPYGGRAPLEKLVFEDRWGNELK